MQDPKNIRVLPELEISKKVLEDYKDKHVLHCTKEQMDKYYSTFINLLQLIVSLTVYEYSFDDLKLSVW